MFQSDRERESAISSQPDMRRRVFLASMGAALGGALLWRWRRPYTIVASAKSEPGEVTIVQFSDDGKRLEKVKIAKVVKTEEPGGRKAGIKVKDVAELVSSLKSAGVI